MKLRSKLFVMTAATILSSVALTQTPPPNPAPGPGAGRGVQPAIEWPPGYVDPTNPKPAYMPANTPLGSGPYKAIMATEPGADQYVAYYPADLNALGSKKMPVVVWGNGGCGYRGNAFRHFLTEIASHGYFALAGGVMTSDEGRSETIAMTANNALRNPEEPVTLPPAPPPGATPNTQSTVELLSNGIDWAIAESRKQGSKFYNKLDTSKIAVMGMSCGGGLAAHFTADNRVKTVAIWSGATMRYPEWRSALNKPVLIVTGDPRYDIAYYLGLADYEGLKKTKQPMFYAWRNNMTHLGTYRQADGGELSPIAVAWLDWQLQGNAAAGKMFTGDDCGLCTNFHWHVEKRNIK